MGRTQQTELDYLHYVCRFRDGFVGHPVTIPHQMHKAFPSSDESTEFIAYTPLNGFVHPF